MEKEKKKLDKSFPLRITKSMHEKLRKKSFKDRVPMNDLINISLEETYK